MDSELRRNFNQNFTNEKYEELLNYFPKKYHFTVPFRIAETPIFLTKSFKSELIDAGENILNLILKPDILQYSLKGIPQNSLVPGPMGNPNFLAIDFAIASGEDQKPSPRLIEMQAFPSLFGFQNELGKAYKKIYSLPENLSPFFQGYHEQDYLDDFKKLILGDHKPDEVILMEIDPWNQATAIDFKITADLIGINVVDIQTIYQDGKKLYYNLNGKKVWIQRIYNRVIFDELNRRKDIQLNFDILGDYQVEWANHPNWYFRISKFLMPKIQSPYLSETHFLKDLKNIPEDLENYVLKPLYSFSGTGIIFNIKLSDLINIKDPENYILQRKVTYLPIIQSPVGGIKAEIRLLYLWDINENKPKLVNNLGRLSQGEMIGVKFNRDKTWVGGSVALFD